MEGLRSLGIAFSLLTTLPVPSRIPWTPARMRRVPSYFPLVGLVIGLLGTLLYRLLAGSSLLLLTKGVVFSLYFAVITGGFHLDALLDTADAYFSRRSTAERLAIMTDSNVGAFAVLTFGFFVLLRTALFMELFRAEVPLLPLVALPLVSRIFQSAILLKAPYAKDEGLAKMYGGVSSQRLWVQMAWLLFLASLALVTTAWVLLVQMVVALVYAGYWVGFCKRHFGGITGDLLGAYLETVELAMTLVLVFWRW